MPTHGGVLLLILASRAAESVVQLATASHLTPAETVRQLQRLMDRGFIVALAPDGAAAVYHLNAKGVRTEAGAPQERVLLIEDDLVIADLMTLILEAESHATVIVSRTPADATTLLREVAFDLVITDGFSRTDTAMFSGTADILRTAGATPVALFTAHQVELDAARVAGFRDLIAKPFDLDILLQQVQVLLQHAPVD